MGRSDHSPRPTGWFTKWSSKRGGAVLVAILASTLLQICTSTLLSPMLAIGKTTDRSRASAKEAAKLVPVPTLATINSAVSKTRIVGYIETIANLGLSSPRKFKRPLLRAIKPWCLMCAPTLVTETNHHHSEVTPSLTPVTCHLRLNRTRRPRCDLLLPQVSWIIATPGKGRSRSKSRVTKDSLLCNPGK